MKARQRQACNPRVSNHGLTKRRCGVCAEADLHQSQCKHECLLRFTVTAAEFCGRSLPLMETESDYRQLWRDRFLLTAVRWRWSLGSRLLPRVTKALCTARKSVFLGLGLRKLRGPQSGGFFRARRPWCSRAVRKANGSHNCALESLQRTVRAAGGLSRWQRYVFFFFPSFILNY